MKTIYLLYLLSFDPQGQEYNAHLKASNWKHCHMIAYVFVRSGFTGKFKCMRTEQYDG